MKTSSLTPYLYFGGNAEEAIHFYEKALDATVEVLMRFKECPDPIPEEHQFPGFEEAIMHATLTIYGQPLKLSDGCEPGSSIQGFGLSLSLPSKEAA
ncbi:MAG: VOC family protein, partial [Verrucomicrobiota bacterium]